MDRAAGAGYGGASAAQFVRLILVAIVFAAGAVISRVLLASAPPRLIVDLAQPLPVVTWWGNTGALFLTILFLIVALGAIVYAWLLRREAPPVRDVIVAAAIALVAALSWLPLFSSDVYAYAAYGEMARLGINPYAHTVLSHDDPVFRAALWQWTGTLPICVYGTLFVSIAEPVVFLTQHLSVTWQLNAFRLLSCAAFLSSVYLLSRCGSADDTARARRAAFFLGLNPIALWVAAEGHNDTWMLALVLAGVALFRTNRAAGAFIAVLAGAIKIPGLIAGGALAAIGFAQQRDWRVLAGAGAALALVTAASLPLLYGTAHDLAPHGRYAPFVSVQSLNPLLALALAVAVAIQARCATTNVDRFALVALAVWLAIPNPYPWYALWLLPLGAWTSDRRTALTIALVCAVAMLRYIPDAVAFPDSAAATILGIAALLAYAPLARRGIIVRS